MSINIASETNKKKPFWEFPWKYKESFIIAFAILIIGFVIEYFTGNNKIWLPSWPVNLVFILAFWVYFLYLHHYVKHPFVKWLSSTYAAISSISVFTFLVLLMGFTLQSDKDSTSFISKIGLTHVTHSWAYILTSFYLMMILGLTITRRFLPFKIKSIAFLLNHGGLWLVIATASLGSADAWKLSMVLSEGEETNLARDYSSKNLYTMPFNLELIDFKIEEFPPNLGLLDNNTGQLLIKKGDKLVEVKEGQRENIGDWNILIEKYYPSAIIDIDTYIYEEEIGSVHAAYVFAENVLNGEKKEGWVSNGSMLYNPEFLILDSEHSIVMTIPSPKEYSSQLKVFLPDGNTGDVKIEVNKPGRVLNWTIYQVGYDESMGKWSKTSIVELVRDPWLPVVYVGIFMILAGSLYLAWMGRMKK